MQQTKDQKIADDINKLILSLNPNASESFKDNIKSYAKKVLSSHVSSMLMPQKPQQLKQKILAKVQKTQDNKAVLHCQEAINRLMLSNNVQKKSQILKMLLKSSQLNNKNSSDFSNVFKEQKYSILNQTQQSMENSKVQQTTSPINRSSLSFLKSKRPQNSIESTLKNKGSPSQGIQQCDLLKQVSFVLQNIQSNYIDFDQFKKAYNLRSNINVSETIRKMISQLCDLGWLFKKITSSITQKGSIAKALNLAISSQMNLYFRWLAVIQSQNKNKSLTFRRLVLWSYQPLQKMKWLAIILEQVKLCQGCQIITVINSFRPQGSHEVSKLLDDILTHLIEPFLKYIYHWIYNGELIDQHKQYFIRELKNKNKSEEWFEKFSIIQSKIPNIIDKETALMIFNSGKTIYFLKNHCQYSYHPTVPFIDSKKILNNSKNLCFYNILSADFIIWLKKVSTNVNQELVKVMFNHFDLKYHLQSMKNFYLIGKGDFIQHLVDNLGEQMNKPKHQIYQRTLDGYISDGLMKCFTDFKMKKQESKYINQKSYDDNSYVSNIINRLLAKMILQYGDTAWDCFNFQYSLERADKLEPVATLLSPSAMKNYQKIFQILWKVKRIQQTLKDVWMSHQKSFPKIKNNKCDFQLQKILHNCHLLRTTMSHFLTNLYSYLMIAIQQKWNQFMEKVDKTQSFDEIIKLHMQLQIDLLDITLNTQSKRTRLISLGSIFQIIQKFNSLDKKLQDEFNQYYQKCRLHENRQLIAERSLISLNNSEDYQIPIFNGAKLAKDLSQMRNIYGQAFKTFYEGLKKESQIGNSSVLLFRLDFSEFYSYEFQPEI